MALVVFAFAAILMLAEGLQRTLVDSGSYDNVVVIRKSSNSEVQSTVSRLESAIVETQPEIAAGPGGRPLAAREVVVLINLRKRGSNSTSNVTIRGTTESSLALRPQVRMTAGRMPRPGLSEIMVGEGIAQRFQNAFHSPTGDGQWSGCSTPATPASTPRSGATPSSSCRRFGGRFTPR
jgi:hypothetical protein